MISLIINHIFEIINTVILVILFFYQRNKNKVLIDRINNQNTLLDEQSTAIENQSKVVDSAIKLFNAVNPEKIENIIKREASLEHSEKAKKFIDEISDLKKGMNDNDAKKDKIIANMSNYLVELAIHYSILLSVQDQGLREASLQRYKKS